MDRTRAGRIVVGLVVISWLVADTRTARAVDQTLPGTKLDIRDASTRRSLVFQTKSSAVVAPSGPDAPTTVGATFQVFNPNSGESATFDMPAANWSVNSTGTMFRFRNRSAPAGPSAVKLAVIKDGRLIKVSAKDSGLTLDEPTQGSVGIVLTSGTRRYCALFDSGIVRDQPGRFSARNAPAPAACPSVAT